MFSVDFCVWCKISIEFIILLVNTWCSQGCLLKRLSFFPSCVQELLSKTIWLHMCRFISGVCFPSVYICLLYASTILLLLHNFVICFETRQHLYEAYYIMFTKYINLTGHLSYSCVPSLSKTFSLDTRF